MNGLFIEGVSVSELRGMMTEVMEKMLSSFTTQPNEQPKYLTREEAAGLLRISLPTLHELTKKGDLKGYRLGGRVLYREDEVVASLKEIQSQKYRRNG